MKRLFILLLAIVFCCALLVGCGKNKDVNDNSDNNVTDNSGTDNGGTENGGTDNGGAENGGTENGGSENGGSENGGSENGGSENGGSENGDSENGGSENGGSENGGSEHFSEGLEYTLSDDETYYIVSGIGTCTDVDVVIPSTYNSLPVSSIDEFALIDCEKIESITIPDSVTSIGESAFSCCLNLTEIITNESNINYKSVDGDLYTKDGKTLIQYAIGKTDSSFTIPNSVTSIAAGVFTYSTNLASVNIPNSVTDIGEDAFYGCSSLTSITIPDSVTSIGDYAFSHCSSLTSVTIGNSVTSIGYAAFSRCSSLTSVTIGNSVTSIGAYAFAECGLSNITIPNSVTGIGECAFCDTRLITAAIPNSVEKIGGYAFSNNYLTKLFCEFEAQPDSWDTDWFGGSVTWGITISADGAIYSINEDGMSYSFVNISGCNDIIYSILPTINGLPVTRIQGQVFNGARNTVVKSVIIPYTVTDISPSAFQWTNLVEIVNNSQTVISPESVAYCNLLELHSGESKITSVDDYLFYVYEGSNYLVGYTGKDTSLVLPDNYNGGSYKIWNCVFRGQTDVTSVIIPNTVTSIGADVFRDCSGLTSINIPDSVTSIGYRAFYGCSSLTSITIPDSVTSIGDDAFAYCTSLTSITYDGTVEEWNAISKGSSWNFNTGNYTIYCTDGEMAKNGTVTYY